MRSTPPTRSSKSSVPLRPMRRIGECSRSRTRWAHWRASLGPLRFTKGKAHDRVADRPAGVLVGGVRRDLPGLSWGDSWPTDLFRDPHQKETDVSKTHHLVLMGATKEHEVGDRVGVAWLGGGTHHSVCGKV